jgi:sortase A
MTNGKQQTGNAACEISDASSNSGRLQSIMKAAEIALLVASLLLAGMYLTARIESYLASRSALENFDAVEPTTASEVLVAEDNAPTDQPDFQDWSKDRIRAYQESTKKPFNALLAILTIPSVGVKVPVFDGTDALTLNHAVGHIAGTAMPGDYGNIGIAGHRDGFFRPLKDIKQGDEIDLKMYNGTDIYTVDTIQIVSPHEVKVLRPQQRPAVTLVTCYPFYFFGSAPRRFIVTAFLTQHNPAGQTTSEARFNPSPTNITKEESQ